MDKENEKEHAIQAGLDEALAKRVCKVCRHDKFGHFDDLGAEYDYCQKCNTACDEEGNILQEGEIPEDPDSERDIPEAERGEK